MLAGRALETAGNGGPRWMAVPRLTGRGQNPAYRPAQYADVAQLAAHGVPNAEVAGSRPAVRSRSGEVNPGELPAGRAGPSDPMWL